MFRSIDGAFAPVVFFFLSYMSLLLPGCFVQGDWEVTLPHDYLLVRCNADDIGMFGPKEMGRSRVVPSLIVGIGVHGDIVYGLVADSSDLVYVREMKEMRARGYFLIDTKMHNVQLGLSKEAWLAALRHNDVKGEPQLAKPSRSFKY